MEIVKLVLGDNFKMNQNSNVKIELTSKNARYNRFPKWTQI